MWPLNIDKILRKCTTKLTAEEEKIVKQSLTFLTAAMIDEGEVTDAMMEQYMPFLRAEKNKDDQVVNHRRALFLNNKEFIAREHEKLAAKKAVQLDKETRKRQREINKAAKEAGLPVDNPPRKKRACKLTLKIKLPSKM